jgi:hypothetical protein
MSVYYVMRQKYLYVLWLYKEISVDTTMYQRNVCIFHNKTEISVWTMIWNKYIQVLWCDKEISHTAWCHIQISLRNIFIQTKMILLHNLQVSWKYLYWHPSFMSLSVYMFNIMELNNYQSYNTTVYVVKFVKIFRLVTANTFINRRQVFFMIFLPQDTIACSIHTVSHTPHKQPNNGF